MKNSEKYQAKTGRRAFLINSAGACAAAALWSLQIPAFASTAPGMVTIIEFAANGKKTGKVVVPKVVKSDAEWRSQLSAISYEVARRAGTERAYSGDTWNLHDRGLFRCVCCDTAVFNSETKFESGTGWPSFTEPAVADAVTLHKDRGFLSMRTEVRCRQCGSHLGHVFRDGPRPTGQRWCINSCALDLEPHTTRPATPHTP